jgi:DNA-binding winged helix-turn-helix (wHTH) protein/tetratricopeptide (TPR) repeat protein
VLRTGPCGTGRAVFASFEFELGTFELRKGGVRRRLEDKPARALAFLIENRALVVDRQDLIILLWPEESHGDFDHRLNKVINKLRLVLGDDSSDPRFIQTFSRRGYRFVAEVSIVVEQLSDGAALACANSQGGAPEIAPDSQASSKDPQIEPTKDGNSSSMFDPPPGAENGRIPADTEMNGRASRGTIPFRHAFFSKKTHAALLSALGILLLGVFVLSANLSHTQASPSQARKSIALVGFTNLSGNPGDGWLDAALTGWITADLANGDQIGIVPAMAVAHLRREAATQGADNLGSDVLAKLRTDLGPDLVVSGSYAVLGRGGDGSMLRLDIQVQDTKTAETLHTISVTGRKSDTFALASSAAAQLRRAIKLGALAPEGLETVREMLPHDPEAARFYTEGVAHLEKSDAVDARALLVQATVIEPQHALSHSALSQAYSELGYNEKARAEAKTAYALSAGLPVADKLLVEGQFRDTSFDWDKAIDVYRSLLILFPENVEYGLRLVRSETSAGKAAMTFETLRQLRQFTLPMIASAELDIAEAEAAASISDFHHEQETAARAAATARQSGDSSLAARAEMIEGEAQLALANFSEAIRLWADATQRFASFGDRSAIARILIDEGELRWQQADLPRAEQSYNQAIATSREIGDEAGLGRALAGLGHIKMYAVSSEQGRKLCDDALAIFRRMGNQREEAYVLSLIADTMAWRHVEAKRLYEQSLEISRKVNDRSRTAGRLMDLGIMATVQGDLTTAERDLQESLRIYHEIGERNREALQMSRLAIVFKWEGRLDDAEKLSQQAIEILKSVGETSVRGQVRQNLALIQLEAGKLTEAEQSVRLAMEEHREGNDLGSLDLANVNLAEILAAEGKWAESRRALGEVGKLVHWNLMPGEHVTAAILTRARLYSSDREFSAALREAQRGCDEALRMDQGSLYMKARLVLGEIELRSGKEKTGRRHLQELAREAEEKGFRLINGQAQKALETRLPRLAAANSPTP